MLSFVESDADVAELRRLDSKAEIVAKIESVKGLDYCRNRREKARLMAARGDLYIEVRRPHHIVKALQDIIAADADAIAASRVLDSMAESPEPSCADITDVACLRMLGYKTMMLGDEVCLQRDSVVGALNLLEAMERDCYHLIHNP
jgi:pyruvate kinase